MAFALPGIGGIADSALTGGASGDAFSGDVRFAPVNIGGLFGSTATSSSNLLPLAIVAGVVLLAAVFIFRR
jgi:hypothetical protein